MKAIQSQITEKATIRDTKDSAKVQIGAMTPSFPPVKVPPRALKDGDKIRMGAMTPAFPKA
jgi:hypothetical protein